MVSVACLTVGSRVAYDGGVWTVIALAGDRVTVEEQALGTDAVGADRVAVVGAGQRLARSGRPPRRSGRSARAGQPDRALS